MSWFLSLAQLYDKVVDQSFESHKEPLTPICHSLQNAHINVVIDIEGNFISASVDKRQIPIQVTEDSDNRGSDISPHPFSEKIQYVANCSSYIGDETPHHEAYITQLSKIKERIKSPEVSAIFKYVSSNRILDDLFSSKVLFAEDGLFLTFWDLKKDPEDPEDLKEPAIFKVLPKVGSKVRQTDALVCFTVGDKDTWASKSFMNDWIIYDTNRFRESGVCCITGDNVPLVSKFPSKLRHPGDKAKLISSADRRGFTWRGMFSESNEVFTVGYNTCLKAFSMLTWLIKDRAFRCEDQVYVVWSDNGLEYPNIFNFSSELNNLDISGNFHILGLTSLTKGRMSVIFYDYSPYSNFKLMLSSFIDDISWFQRWNCVDGDTIKVKWAINPPSFFCILKSVFGEGMDSNQTSRRRLIESLIPALLEGSSIPSYMVINSIKNTFSTRNVLGKWDWFFSLSASCSLYRLYKKRTEGITYDIKLDNNLQTRDYVLGRIIAIYERIESFCLHINNSKRETNVGRLFKLLSIRPLTTLDKLEIRMKPYMVKVSVYNQRMYNDLSHLLFDLYDILGDCNDNSPLNGEFLLAYHSQQLELY